MMTTEARFRQSNFPSNLTSQRKSDGPPAFAHRKQLLRFAIITIKKYFALYRHARYKRVFMRLNGVKTVTHLSETSYSHRRSVSNRNQILSCPHHRRRVSRENIAFLIGCCRFKCLRVVKVARAFRAGRDGVALGKVREKLVSNTEIAGKAVLSEAGLKT